MQTKKTKPMTPQRIKDAADKYIDQVHGHIGDEQYNAYIAGATAEYSRARQQLKEAQNAAKMFCNKHNETATQLAALVDKAQGLVDALEEFISYHETGLLPARHIYEKVVAKLKEWKWKGEGEPKPIEYMPIHPEDAKKSDCPKQFPMHLLDEAQAQRNHSQSLKRLKERGGLSVREILAIVGKKPWSHYGNMPWDEAIKMLNDIVIKDQQKSK